MKIWLQTSTAIGRDPLWTPYEESLKKHSQKIARQGTTVDVHGVEHMSTGIDRSAYIEYLNTSMVINNAVRAEREGFDAFALTCMLDPGFFELKEVVDIPIAFSLECSAHFASIFAPKFALLAYNEVILRRMSERIKFYGVEDKLVPSPSFTVTLEALQGGFKDPEPLLKLARPVVKKAAENGADMLISLCGCMNMIFVTHGIKAIEGIPIVDSVGISIKTAELMVDFRKMGMERVSRGLYSRLGKEELATVRKLYKVE